MPQYLDGVKRVKKQPAAVQSPAPAADTPTRGVGKWPGFFDMINWNAAAERRVIRQQRRRSEQLARREGKMQREQERLQRIAAERETRTAALWQSAAEAKKYEEEKRKKKERLKKARAKLKAERLALKLQKQTGKVSAAPVAAGGVSVWQKLRHAVASAIRAVARRFFFLLRTLARRSFRYVAFIVLYLVFFVGALALLVYATPAQNPIRQVLIYNLPFPALIIDYRPVSYPAYLAEKRLLGDYYVADGSAALPADLVRQHLIEKSIFQRLQRRYHVTVSADEQNAVFAHIAAANGGEEQFIETLYNAFGLTKNLFIANVAYYDALKIKLADAFVADDAVNQSAFLRVQNVLKLLGSGKQSFEELAQSYSEDGHALQGGDSGYVKTAAMSDELREVAAKLDAGMTSGVLQEAGRYYIVKVYDRQEPKTGEEVWLKQISIFTNYTFTDYLSDLEKNAKVWDLRK